MPSEGTVRTRVVYVGKHQISMGLALNNSHENKEKWCFCQMNGSHLNDNKVKVF